MRCKTASSVEDSCMEVMTTLDCSRSHFSADCQDEKQDEKGVDPAMAVTDAVRACYTEIKISDYNPYEWHQDVQNLKSVDVLNVLSIVKSAWHPMICSAGGR